MSGYRNRVRSGTESKPKPLRRPAGDVPAIRACLRCRAPFQSGGWHERLCRNCKAPRLLAADAPHV